MENAPKFEGLIEYHIETHSDNWFKFRTTGFDGYGGGIGASETAKICGHDDYSPSIGEVYHHKVGTYFPEPFDNERMLHGRISEQQIIDFTALFDGTKESYIKNYEKYIAMDRPQSMRVREIHRVRSYIVNPKYPWLFISLDGAIDKNSFRIRDGIMLDNYAPLEIKTIGEQQAKQYEAGFPSKYVYQINQQMLVLGVDYGEIAVLKDGKYYDLHPFERNEDICQEILEKTHHFWHGRVLKGREYFEAYKEALRIGNKQLADRAMASIDKYEPYPDGTDASFQWKKRRVQEAIENGETEKVLGDVVDYINCRYYDGCKELEKLIKAEQNKVKSLILESMRFNKTKYLNFDKDGRATISSDGKLLIKITHDSSVTAREVIKKLDLRVFE